MTDKEILEFFKQGILNTIFYKSSMVINLIDRMVFGCVNTIIEEDNTHFILDVKNATYAKTSFHIQYRFDIAPSQKEGFNKIISICQIL